MSDGVKKPAGRRKPLPGADELFRATAPKDALDADGVADAAELSGRVRHDEKITVYVTAEELLALETARLKVRAGVGRNVDRGRFVRAALAVALEDLELRGAQSDIVGRISDTLGSR